MVSTSSTQPVPVTLMQLTILLARSQATLLSIVVSPTAALDSFSGGNSAVPSSTVSLADPQIHRARALGPWPCSSRSGRDLLPEPTPAVNYPARPSCSVGVICHLSLYGQADIDPRRFIRLHDVISHTARAPMQLYCLKGLFWPFCANLLALLLLPNIARWHHSYHG